MKDQFNTMQSQVQSILGVLSNSNQSDKNKIAKQLIEKGIYKSQS
jgi:hypothetical protein